MCLNEFPGGGGGGGEGCCGGVGMAGKTFAMTSTFY